MFGKAKNHFALISMMLLVLAPVSSLFATSYPEEEKPLLSSQPGKSPTKVIEASEIWGAALDDLVGWCAKVEHNLTWYLKDLDYIKQKLQYYSEYENLFYSTCRSDVRIPRNLIEQHKASLEEIRLKFLAEKNAPKVPCPIPVASASTSVSRKSSADSAESIDLEDMEEPGAPGSSVRHRKPSARSSATVGGSGGDSDEASLVKK